MYIQSCFARWSFSLGLDDNIPSTFIMSVHGDSIKLFANNLGCFSSSHLQFVYDLRRYLCAHRPIAHTHTSAHTPLVICICAAHFSRFHKIFAHIFMLPNDRCGYFVVIHAVPKIQNFHVLWSVQALPLFLMCVHTKKRCYANAFCFIVYFKRLRLLSIFVHHKRWRCAFACFIQRERVNMIFIQYTLISADSHGIIREWQFKLQISLSLSIEENSRIYSRVSVLIFFFFNFNLFAVVPTADLYGKKRLTSS